jgi:hypothetical protein
VFVGWGVASALVWNLMWYYKIHQFKSLLDSGFPCSTTKFTTLGLGEILLGEFIFVDFSVGAFVVYYITLVFFLVV